MKKTPLYLLIFSTVYYVLYYFLLIDAPAILANVALLIGFGLSIVCIAYAVLIISKKHKEKWRVGLPEVALLVINVVIFLLLLIYILGMYFLPYNISVG